MASGDAAVLRTRSDLFGRLITLLRGHTLPPLILLLLALCAGVEIVRPGTVTPTWVSNTVLFAVPLGILGASQTIVLLTGGIDLSVSLVATAAAFLLASNAVLGTPAAVLIALSAGLVVGLLNGIGVGLLRVQPLVMTLGTALMGLGAMTIYSQLVIAVHPEVPASIRFLGSGKLLGGLPADIMVWLPLSLIIILGLRFTGFGRLLFAVGSNPGACHLAGIRVWRVLLAAYVLASLLAALAGLVLVGSTNAADLGLADALLLPSAAAAIIGGNSIFGGSGGYGGTIVGTLILTVLNSLLTLLDMVEPVKQILYGAIILLLAALYSRIAEQ
jgi:ribose transport system permease protein